MRSLENAARPFELIKLLRDGDTKAFELLHLNTRMSHFLTRTLNGLIRAGFAMKTDGDGPWSESLAPTETLLEFLSDLDLSLTQLAPYTRNSVVCNPTFGPPNEPLNKARVFVVMPFVSELKPVYDDHILEVTKRLGLSSARGDDFFTADSIVTDIWNAIFSANLIVADCTGRNPNVFYEIGVAHTIGKPVILISQNIEDIPFDLKQFRAIVYDFTPRGMKQFEKDLSFAMESVLEQPTSLKEVADRERKARLDWDA